MQRTFDLLELSGDNLFIEIEIVGLHTYRLYTVRVWLTLQQDIIL